MQTFTESEDGGILTTLSFTVDVEAKDLVVVGSSISVITRYPSRKLTKVKVCAQGYFSRPFDYRFEQ